MSSDQPNYISIIIWFPAQLNVIILKENSSLIVLENQN